MKGKGGEDEDVDEDGELKGGEEWWRMCDEREALCFFFFKILKYLIIIINLKIRGKLQPLTNRGYNWSIWKFKGVIVTNLIV